MDIAALHPQIVHFVIALLIVGVIFRVISLTPWLKFTGPAATSLILIGTVAAVLAVKSGDEAHGPAERIPGARPAVETHEEWGKRAKNIFLVVAALEIAVFVLRRNERQFKLMKIARVASAAVGLFGVFALYETGEHGGEIVYEYAGGVGTRSGNPEAVQNLLVAGLYHRAMLDREEGRGEDAARLIEELVRRRGEDPGVRLLGIESVMLDRSDPRTALDLLNQMPEPGDDRTKVRAGLMRVDAYEALHLPDSARAVLDALKQQFPDNARVTGRTVQ